MIEIVCAALTPGAANPRAGCGWTGVQSQLVTDPDDQGRAKRLHCPDCRGDAFRQLGYREILALHSANHQHQPVLMSNLPARVHRIGDDE